MQTDLTLSVLLYIEDFYNVYYLLALFGKLNNVMLDEWNM